MSQLELIIGASGNAREGTRLIGGITVVLWIWRGIPHVTAPSREKKQKPPHHPQQSNIRGLDIPHTSFLYISKFLKSSILP
jgi:hypothetical protein